MYQYQPLADADTEIRLAAIEPGAFDDPIEITFEYQSLQDDESAWEALSYAWGSDEQPSRVQVGSSDEIYIPITHNLDVALRHLRYEDKDRFIWIDALCIDQSSIEEKSRQVAIMGEIFAKAYPVIIWLGPERNKSDEAMEILRLIGCSVDINWSSSSMKPSKGCLASEKHFAKRGTPLPYRNGALTPVLDLFQREYFKRVWIRQEIALANCATIYCGHKRLGYQAFRNAVACLLYKAFYYSAIPDGQMSAWEFVRALVYRISTLRPGTCSYTSLGQYLGDAECRDPRDRIYAMLSLMRQPDSLIGIEPDYSQTTEQLYASAALRIMKAKQSLSLLESCILPTQTLDIPSWVPDWSVPWKESNINPGWSACGWISAKMSILDARRICVSGVPVTRVAAVLRADVGEIKDEQGRCDAIVEVLRAVESLSRELETEPMHQRMWVDIFCLVATNRRHAESYHPRRTNGKMFSTFQQYVDVVEAVCFSTDRLEDATIPFKEVLLGFQRAWLDLEFFFTTDGYIGLAKPGVREGDLVNVLFGSRFPVILRPQHQETPEDFETWQVVGVAMVGSLMEGEIFYGR